MLIEQDQTYLKEFERNATKAAKTEINKLKKVIKLKNTKLKKIVKDLDELQNEIIILEVQLQNIQ